MRSNEAVKPLSRLEFEDLAACELLVITTGSDDEAWVYEFLVEDTTEKWPRGHLVATNPQGVKSEPMAIALHGCGKWTTREQNPVQQQMGLAFTPYYDGLIVGRLLFGMPEGSPERIVFGSTGQEISAIEVQSP